MSTALCLSLSLITSPSLTTVAVRPHCKARLRSLLSVATAPRRGVTIRSEPWPEVLHSPFQSDHVGSRHVYLSAVSAAYGPIGGAGMQLIPVDADGQNQHVDAPGKKLRAVVTGTLNVSPAWRACVDVSNPRAMD